MSFTMPYSKLYIMTNLSANDVKFISVDRQDLDLLKYITYGTVHSIFVGIQPDSTKKMTSYALLSVSCSRVITS